MPENSPRHRTAANVDRSMPAAGAPTRRHRHCITRIGSLALAHLLALPGEAWASGPAQASPTQTSSAPATPAPDGPTSPAPAPAGGKPPAVPQQGDIIVTGQRPTSIDSVDRHTYIVSGDPDAKTGMAIDLLRKLPSVQTTPNGGVTLRGDARVNVLIDGKRPTNGNQALQSLSGAEIDRIEVLTNPPAEFSAEGAAGVINIITKRRTPLGFTGSASARVTSQDREVVSALANLSNGTYTAKLALNAQRTSLPSDAVTTYYLPDPAAQTNRLRGENRNARADLTLKSRIGKDGALSLILLAFNGKRTGTDDITYRSSNGSYTGRTVSANVYSNRVIEGLYETKLASGSIDVSIDGRHEVKTAPYRSDTVLDIASGGTVRYGQRLSNTGATDDLKADLTWRSGAERQAKLGFEINDDATNVDNSFYNQGLAPDIGASDGLFRFHGRQTLYTGYASWQQPVLGWTALAGLRFEQQKLSLRADGAVVPRTNSAFYPSLHLSHDIAANRKIKLSYTRRVSRPGIEEYNPGVRTQTTNVTEVGNPNLKSSNTDSVEAQYVFNRGNIYFEAGLFYKYTADLLGVLNDVSPNGQITIMPINRGHSTAAGISGTFRTPLVKNVKGSFDANVARVTVPSIVGNQRSNIRVNASYTIDFKPPTRNKNGADAYQLQFTYTGRTLNLQGYTAATYRLDASWSHPISKDLTLTLSATDITDGQRSRTVVQSPGIDYAVERRPYARSIQLGIAYSFNKH